MAMEHMQPVMTKLANGNDAAKAIHRVMREIVDAPTPRGTMAAWFQSRHGETVTTIQVDNARGAVWAPTGRIVDAQSYRGKVLLDGSARDYAGMRVLSASEDAIIVADDWHTIAYVIESRDQ